MCVLVSSADDRARDRIARSERFLEHEPKLLRRTCAMGHAVLLVFGQLRHRPVASLDEEERVVAEAAGAAGRARDLAVARPFDDEGLAVANEGIDQREDAAEARLEVARPRAGL